MSDYSGREYSEERREEDDDISINDSRKRRRSSELEYGAAVARRTVSQSTGDVVMATAGPSRPTNDPASAALAYKRGMSMYHKLLNVRDPYDYDRLLSADFMQAPSRADYPDYYKMIKKPMSLEHIKDKLDKHSYQTLEDVHLDLNQLFVNAKRYNSAGSPIFMDAKKLHKLVKDTFINFATEGYVTEPDSPPPPRPPPIPVTTARQQHSPKPKQQHDDADAPIPTPMMPYPFKYENPNNRLPGGPSAKKGETTLKPWLTGKLAELKLLKDTRGRFLFEPFKSLPARGAWPRYYQVIHFPISLDTIGAKCLKRAYLSVEQFVEDCLRCFTNAQYFNEQSSQIWHDAAAMIEYLKTVMLEVPPIFAAPRKYNTTRKRAEDDAEAKGLPAPHHTTQKREKGRSVSHSVQPEGSPPAGGHPPYDHTERKTYAESADGSDYGGNESRGYSPTTGNYELPGWFPTAESREASEAPDGGVLGLDGDGVIGSNDIQPQVRINPLQAATLPLAIAMGSKSLSRIVSKEEIPAIYQFNIQSTPTSMNLTLPISNVRQHSFAVPRTTTRLDIALHFQHELSALRHAQEPAPVIKQFTAKPPGTLLETVNGEGVENRFALVPEVGLTVVEFVVGVPEDNVTEEVYRLFVRK